MTDTIPVPEGCKFHSFVRIINSGGFGTVVELIEKSTNIHYAGKIVQCLTQKHKDRFDREVGRLKTFLHPRIIKLKETVAMESSRVMVMELGGRSLAEIVQDYTKREILMPREEVYRVMEDISSALELMHNHESGRTAHGDIKMENILMDADGHAKLCDFGAAESEDVSSSRSVMSQLYVSPERMESETGAATCEADVWALGVVLYWLLIGEPPFTSKNPALLFRDIASFKPVSIPNSCGEEERVLLMRMMDPCALTRLTSRQLCLGKTFRCLVNTVEGVWKLKDEEQAKRVEAEETTRKTEEEKMVTEEKLKKTETRIMQLVKKQNQEMVSLNHMKQQLADLSVFVGTDSLRTFDEAAHTLTPTTLTQIIKLENTDWRTVFTFPIDEGEWELKIRGNYTVWNVMLGFLNHPLPENVTQHQCGADDNGIGGDFTLWNGGMWQGGKYIQPAGTNERCNGVGQTAAIRVNMSTREARLFVDDSEQPGIFTDIPSPLCLGITTGFRVENGSIDVLHLSKTENLETERAKWAFSLSAQMNALENEKLKTKMKMERMRMMMPTAWVGTESLQTIDKTAHKLTPTTLTQIVKLEKGEWRTAFTFPIDEGEWELKIRGNVTNWGVMLGFIRHPFPEDATQSQCGSYFDGIGGQFELWNGGMWKGGEVRSQGTNKTWDQAGLTAAIRVNMSTREARLFVDDEAQPGIFTDIPSPLCLGISTLEQNARIDVIYLATTESLETERTKWVLSMSTRIQALEEEKLTTEERMERMRMMMRTEWIGTESLKTIDRTVPMLTPTQLTQIVKLEKNYEWRTAFSFPIDEGEWELKIRGNDSSWNVMLGFLKYPLPEDATQTSCGCSFSWIGGDFELWSGGMWQRWIEIKPARTN
ncbi:putative Carbon catabolite-derepressing protein kinase [Blattamonas nauphoetae]|uniref:Carbon catabolite-derepressing protein kinase n=1 Tax=Blattamonas nauphoetae TaxID=2049346 RepID=A0ABQ9X5T6_9EUKA|nr:putative Carbon catabolite-derepressing protein kinase [Blattamonas nauphoetae]